MKEMLDLADTYDFRPLLGDVYHIYLKITLEPREPSCDPGPAPFPDPSLSELHRGRIMTGHWSLDDCWQRLAMNVPRYPIPGCASGRLPMRLRAQRSGLGAGALHRCFGGAHHKIGGHLSQTVRHTPGDRDGVRGPRQLLPALLRRSAPRL